MTQVVRAIGPPALSRYSRYPTCVVPRMATTGGVNGPMNSPAAPPAWNIAATAGEHSRTDAASGMTTVDNTAFAPIMVPRAALSSVPASIVPSWTRSCDPSPTRRISACTSVCAAPVRAATSPSPAPSTTMNPTITRNEPSDWPIRSATPSGEVRVITAALSTAPPVASTTFVPASTSTA